MSNADQAVYVLMTEHFSLAKGLYYWGQDRFGSLIPALAHPLTYIMPSIWALTLVQMLSLFGAWWIWSKSLDRPLSKIVLAAAFWLPPLAFYSAVVIAQPYHILLLLWGLCIHLAKRESKLSWGLAGLTLGLSYWVSEVSIVLVGWMLIYYVQPSKWRRIIPMVLGALPGIALILAAKNNATRIPIYQQQMLVDFNEFTTGIARIFEGIIAHSLQMPISRWAAMTTHILLVVIAIILIIRTFRLLYKWMILRLEKSALDLAPAFLLFGLLALTLSSYWVYYHETSIRYFAMLYPLGIFFWLQTFDKKKSIPANLLVIAMMFTGVIDTFRLYTNLEIPENRMSFNEAKQFIVEENAVYIGDYWTVYMPGFWHPNKAYYFSHEDGYVRNSHQLKEVFKTDQKIFAIGDNWLESFPDTLNQFQRQFIKLEETENAGYQVARYEVVVR
ncbi:MAG: hypothetical protein EA358_01410 [Flavobacteriales bacterium]|nr:MAG: hypothetical protein EA358_01410 [Flavobacteriales bacterium]